MKQLRKVLLSPGINFYQLTNFNQVLGFSIPGVDNKKRLVRKTVMYVPSIHLLPLSPLLLLSLLFLLSPLFYLCKSNLIKWYRQKLTIHVS